MFEIAYKIQPLKNGASEDINVNGATVNKHFKWDVTSGEDWHLESISLFLLDTGIMAWDKFGSITALTNGLDLNIKKKGSSTTVKGIKNNIDVLTTFSKGFATGDANKAFLDEDDYFFGSIIFKNPIRLSGNDSDLVEIVVKDDLTTIDVMRAQATFWRKI